MLSVIALIISVVTLAIVLWYTFETRRIRVEAQNQNALLSEQNSLLSRQFALLQREHDRERLREESAAQPIFRLCSGSLDEKAGNLRLTNYGGAIQKLQVWPTNGAELKRTKWPFVDRQENIILQLSKMPQPRLERLSFQFSYIDNVGEQRVRLYHYLFSGNRFVEDGV